MNGDLQELMEHISTLHNDQMAAISKLDKEFSEHKGNIEARVKAVETEQEKASTRQWIHTAVIVPAFASVHAIANYFGVKI